MTLSSIQDRSEARLPADDKARCAPVGDIGEEVCETLEDTPAKLEVPQHVRLTYRSEDGTAARRAGAGWTRSKAIDARQLETIKHEEIAFGTGCAWTIHMRGAGSVERYLIRCFGYKP
ncbi:hypothetical protein D9M68_579510 [compost metagenome]